MDTFARFRISAYTIHMRCVSHNVFHFTQSDVRIIYGTANKYLRAVEPNNAHTRSLAGKFKKRKLTARFPKNVAQ